MALILISECLQYTNGFVTIPIIRKLTLNEHKRENFAVYYFGGLSYQYA